MGQNRQVPAKEATRALPRNQHLVLSERKPVIFPGQEPTEDLPSDRSGPAPVSVTTGPYSQTVPVLRRAARARAVTSLYPMNVLPERCNAAQSTRGRIRAEP